MRVRSRWEEDKIGWREWILWSWWYINWYGRTFQNFSNRRWVHINYFEVAAIYFYFQPSFCYFSQAFLLFILVIVLLYYRKATFDNIVVSHGNPILFNYHRYTANFPSFCIYIRPCIYLSKRYFLLNICWKFAFR